MRKLLVILIGGISFSLFSDFCNAQIITTVSGDGIGGYNGDGIQATAAEMWATGGNVIFDRQGSFYTCDRNNNRVRKVNSSGIITTIAGNGMAGNSGDGGQATAAEFNECTYVSMDSSHNMYVADFNNNCIRKINTSGIVSTFAGNRVIGYSGDGGQATAAELDLPCAVVADNNGNIYIADSWNNVVRKVNAAGKISTIAGTGVAGFSGDGGPAFNAELNKPFRIGFDDLWNIYIADSFNSRIRKINTSGIITTVAGNGFAGFSGDGGPATAAEMDSPDGMCVDVYGNIIIADTYNNRIRFVNTSGIITTVAGNGVASFSGDGGPAIAAELFEPTGTALSYYNDLYIDDYANNRIRKFRMIQITDGTIELSKGDKITVFPNPSNGMFTVEMKSENLKVKNMEVYNILGVQIFSHTPTGGTTFSIDLRTQPGGIYLYRVLGEDGTLVGQGKLIIQK